jgi:protein-tyrosine phosphatase
VERWTPIRDAAPAPDLAWLRKTVAFIDKQRRAGRTVYVHCFAGVSRSAMVVTAYYMHEKGWTRDEALAFVRTRRPQVRPNPAFMELLLEWEKELSGKEGEAP